MLTRFHSYLLLILFILISGCAHVISDDLRTKVDPSVDFAEVFQNPNVYKEKMVLWGGEILQTLPQKDGTTLIEILQWPLG
jgi:outer membrane lipoprotein